MAARSQEAAARVALTHKIADIIEQRKMTSAEIVKILDLDVSKVSALKRGKLAGLPLERLLRFVVLLGRDVDIVLRRHSRGRRHGRLVVV